MPTKSTKKPASKPVKRKATTKAVKTTKTTKTARPASATRSSAPVKRSQKRVGRRLYSSILLGGIASVVFGIVAFFSPEMTLNVLVTIASIFVMATGIIWILQGLFSITRDRLWWLAILLGALVTSAGSFLFRNPEVAFRLFAILLAAFIFIQAIWDLIAASYSGRRGRLAWMVLGILGVIVGFIILNNPVGATIFLTWVLGIYAIVHGISAIVFALRARSNLQK